MPYDFCSDPRLCVEFVNSLPSIYRTDLEQEGNEEEAERIEYTDNMILLQYALLNIVR
jgi:hypothetical protein